MPVYFGEFLFSRKAEFDGDFEVPTAPTPYYGPGGNTVYPAPLGFQNFPMDFSDSIAINTGDFTIHGHFHIDYKYWTYSPDDPKPIYTIIGQFDGNMELIGAIKQNYWALELYEDIITFKIWDYSSQSFVTSISGPSGINWETVFTNYRKANLSAAYIHVAVVRQDDEVRLWIAGHIVDTQPIADWDASTAVIKYNGQTGYICDEIPHSPFTTRELSVTNTVEWWEDDFTPRDFSATGSLVLYPRVGVHLVHGYAGTMRGKIFIPLRIGVELRTARVAMSRSDTVGFTDSLVVLKNPIHGAFNLPRLTSTGIGAEGASAAGSIRLFEATGFTGLAITGSIRKLTVDTFVAVAGTVTRGNVTLPKLSLTASTEFISYGEMLAVLPRLTSTGVMFDIPVGWGLLTLSALQMYSKATMLNLDVLGICVNTEINAISQYDDWDFNSMCIFNGEVIGASDEGIFIHSGDNDGAVPINAFFRLFSTDLGTIQQKRIRKLFIEGKLGGYMEAKSIFDNADETTYQIACPPVMTTVQTIVETNYNDKGILFGLRVSNKGGSDFSIDSISAIFVPTALPPKTFTTVGRAKVSIPALEAA